MQFMSQRDRLPPTTQQLMATLESATAHNNRLLLNIAAAYGGQQDIISAAQALARKVQQGLLQPEQVRADQEAVHIYMLEPVCAVMLECEQGMSRIYHTRAYGNCYSLLAQPYYATSLSS